jgi:RNA polymerase sigma-70 factor (ECF subfamily)
MAEAEWVRILHAIAAGDASALRTLYGRTHTLVFTLIERIVRNRQAAGEITLDVFQGIWKRARTYRAEQGTVVGWIMNEARSRALHAIRFGTPADSDPREDPAPGKRLQAAVALLTPAERNAIERAFFPERFAAEAASHKPQSAERVTAPIREAIEKLRLAMREDTRR